MNTPARRRRGGGGIHRLPDEEGVGVVDYVCAGGTIGFEHPRVRGGVGVRIEFLLFSFSYLLVDPLCNFVTMGYNIIARSSYETNNH